MKGRIQYDVYTDSVPIQPMEKMSFGQTTPVTAEKSSGFGAILENAMKDLETLQAQSAEDSRKLALGEIDNIAQGANQCFENFYHVTDNCTAH